MSFGPRWAPGTVCTGTLAPLIPTPRNSCERFSMMSGASCSVSLSIGVAIKIAGDSCWRSNCACAARAYELGPAYRPRHNSAPSGVRRGRVAPSGAPGASAPPALRVGGSVRVVLLGGAFGCATFYLWLRIGSALEISHCGFHPRELAVHDPHQVL